MNNNWEKSLTARLKQADRHYTPGTSPNDLGGQLAKRRTRRRTTHGLAAVAAITSVATGGAFAVQALGGGDPDPTVIAAPSKTDPAASKSHSNAVVDPKAAVSQELRDAAVAYLFPATAEDARLVADVNYFYEMHAVAACKEPKLVEHLGLTHTMAYKISLDPEYYREHGMFGNLQVSKDGDGGLKSALACFYGRGKGVPAPQLSQEVTMSWHRARQTVKTSPATWQLETRAAKCLKDATGVPVNLELATDFKSRGGFMYAVSYAFDAFAKGAEEGSASYDKKPKTYGVAYADCAAEYHQQVSRMLVDARTPLVKKSSASIEELARSFKDVGFVPGAAPPKPKAGDASKG